MSTIKTFKKGEVLFREGEKPTNLFFIQGGQVSLQLTRQKQTIELCVLGNNQICGEHGLAGVPTNPHTAIALTEVKTIEMGVELVRTQIEAGTQLVKFLTKSLAEKSKVVMKDFTSMKLERDNTPCPPDQTAKIFGTLYHVARTKGENQENGLVRVEFRLLKQYAQRVFLESPKRLEMAMNVFVKLGVAKYEWAKLEDDPAAVEEISHITFSDLPLVEQFFEYFQYYYFKGGKGELLKTDDRVIALAEMLVQLASGLTADRRGSVSLDYTKVVEKYREVTGLALNGDHFTALETKGLFVKRASQDTGVFLSFDLNEFVRTVKIWKVLREVERWNDKGFVDPNEPVEAPKKKASAECPSCHKPYEGQPKFCSECGFKIVAAA